MNSPPQADMACGGEHSALGTDVEVEVLAAPPAIGPLIARAAARGALPGRSRSNAAHELPAKRVVLCDQSVDIEQLAAYARVCGFTLRDALPTTYLHVLTFPTQIHLLSTPDFPLPALGLVHVSNEMTLLQPVSVTESLTMTSWAQHLRPHRKGATVEMVGEVSVENEVVWRGVSTYLARGAQVSEAASKARDVDAKNDPGAPSASDAPRGTNAASDTSTQSAASHVAASQLPTWARWRCPADLGRRYAAASGDVNPIHVNSLAARAFGFKGTIAHGMWTHARAMAALEGRVAPTHTVSVEFRKPILLGSTVNFRASIHPSGHDFAVTDKAGERTHMVGSVANG